MLSTAKLELNFDLCNTLIWGAVLTFFCFVCKGSSISTNKQMILKVLLSKIFFNVIKHVFISSRKPHVSQEFGVPLLKLRVIKSMENSDVSKRLLDFILSIGISTSSFAYQCKVSENALLKLNGKQQTILCKIYKAYPQLNPYWLERGGGSMLKKENESIAITDERLITEIRKETEEYRSRRTKVVRVGNDSQLRDRLLLYINYMNMSVKDFALSCSLSESSIYTINKKATPTTLNKIYACYPRLNPVWLQNGEGEMERLTDAVESYRLEVLESENKKLTEQIQLKDEQITKLLAMVEEKDRMIAKLIEKL